MAGIDPAGSKVPKSLTSQISLAQNEHNFNVLIMQEILSEMLELIAKFD
jgi:hypothetical protein